MSNTVFTIRTDPATKQQISDFASAVGLSTSSFMLAASMQAVRDKRVVLTTELEPTPSLRAIMKKAKADHKAGRNVSQSFDNASDMIADLEK